ncbi:Asp-tRNA(Asn)/Glu-tRNA(Gln) amidotransferase subunit GatC [Aciditerrimonas ferrireducens]|uniref:Asp-tRNA(Asn)/Glu-tRNA(Gln) amidotransferase subunit GatC n=1 Tax=Aciditerrimonas ferrireducens TaxID=667306 RepID=UPI0020050DE8|nr:Asp-tRNA(Asn)/Glu-tRNA(Gln) amidotransferase subunit GatC [Aciditerrimonas ferrireducens]MCK4176353.1 Asp-tRNA(Asn)/Glu-tRNA(Gln) amidotransferase subunit GatC [Aciditerrimonas ferrireducens]
MPGRRTKDAGQEPDRITREATAHVARLARIALSPEELDRYAQQLAAVLEHAAQVAAAPTAGVPPTAHPFALVNVLRDDEPRPSLDPAVVLAEAPAAEDGRFKVPPILGEAP